MCIRVYLFIFLIQCHSPLAGIKSSKQGTCPALAQATLLSPSAKRTTCSEVSKNPRSSTLKIYYPKTSSTHLESSTTKQLNGPIKHAPETFPSAALSTQHVRYNKIKCSSSVGATPPTNATTIPSTWNYVILYSYSRLPMVPTSQSEISRTTKECNE